MSAADQIAIQRLVRAVNKKLAKATANTPDIQGGIVQSTSPLTVLMPGAKTAAPAYALPGASGVQVGQKVLVHMVRNELYVAGTAAASVPSVAGSSVQVASSATSGPSWQGAWSSTIEYAADEAVSYEHSSYVSLVNANIGNVPSSSSSAWGLLAQAGAAGPAGQEGPTGPAGPAGPAGQPGTGSAIAIEGAVSWTELEPSASPPARVQAAIANALAQGGLVLFGGWDGSDSSSALADTWVWNGATWQEANLATSPSARWGAAMSYDSNSNDVFLFGGQDASGYLADMWNWNGSTWTELTPTASPPVRAGASMFAGTNSSGTTGTVIFGGYNGSDYLADTWYYNGTTWTELAPTSAPAARSLASAAPAFETGAALLFGGQQSSTEALQDTWYFYNGEWAELLPTSVPSARWGAAMDLNDETNQVTLFGGWAPTVTGDDEPLLDTPTSGSPTPNLLADTWTMYVGGPSSGWSWTQQAPPAAPAPRQLAAFAFLYAGQTGILFGGSDQDGAVADTWSLSAIGDGYAGAPATGEYPTGTAYMDLDDQLWIAGQGGAFVQPVMAQPTVVAGRLYTGSAVAIPTGTTTPTQITGLVEDFVSGGMTASGNELTVPVAGIYQVSAQVFWNNAPSAQVFALKVYRNGSLLRQAGESGDGGVIVAAPSFTDLISLDAGDVLTLYAEQSSGLTADIYPGTAFGWLSAGLFLGVTSA